jgi:hypothetical protein
MTIRNILFIISFGLLSWLFVDSCFQLDIAVTKNNALTRMEKLKVDEIQYIDSVKVYAKSTLDILRQNTIRNSDLATKRIFLLLTLTIILFFLWTAKFKRKISS